MIVMVKMKTMKMMKMVKMMRRRRQGGVHHRDKCHTDIIPTHTCSTAPEKQRTLLRLSKIDYVKVKKH